MATKDKKRAVGKIFKSGNSQAVRIPKEFKFDTDEVFIEELPDGALKLSTKPVDVWAIFKEGVLALDNKVLDAIENRDKMAPQKRDFD